jgi:hypothetical protein
MCSVPDYALVKFLPVLNLAVVHAVDDGQSGGAGQSQGHFRGCGHCLAAS